MATETKPAASEDPKVDLFDDDDEFEEFEIGEVYLGKKSDNAHPVGPVSPPAVRREINHSESMVQSDASGYSVSPSKAEWDDEKEEGKEVVQQWEDDWDDDDVNDDFSQQLKKELESNSSKS